MKYAKRLLVFFILYLVVGGLLLTAALLWSPAGQREGIITGIVAGFSVTGVGGIVLSARLMRNPQKAEQVEIAKTEERTQFLRQKIHSSVYFVTLMLVSAGALVADIFGNRDIALTLAALLVIEAILYVGFATYYTKKY